MADVLGLLCVSGIVIVLGGAVVLTLYSVGEIRRWVERMLEKYAQSSTENMR